MIYISTTQSSKVVVTLNDLVSLTQSAYFTWKILSKNSLEETIFEADDFSISPYYNSFTLSVGTLSSLTGSNVTLDIEQGEYEYTIYQTSNQYSLSTDGLVLERGLMICLGTGSVDSTFTESNDDTVRVSTDL